MKRFLLLLAVCLAMGACSGTKKTASNNDSSNDIVRVKDETAEKKTEINNINGDQPLDQYLRKIPGVVVSGSGSSASVRIRGIATTINSNPDPLFILDGTQVGRSFADINGLINVNDIKSVRVLKDASETSFYGSQGANGVILIKSKKRK